MPFMDFVMVVVVWREKIGGGGWRERRGGGGGVGVVMGVVCVLNLREMGRVYICVYILYYRE